MTAWRPLLAGLLVALALTACNPADELKRQIIPLNFRTSMEVNSDGEFHVSLGVEGDNKLSFPGDNSFGGVMELRDDSGALIARTYVSSLDKIEVGHQAFPDSWCARLLPGKYGLTWGSPKYGWTTTAFEIVQEEERVCLQEPQTAGDALQTPAARRDYGAAHVLIRLATADLAARLGIQSDEVTVKGFETTIFTDTSLGVPEYSKSYGQIMTPGYVVKLIAQGEIYRYHGAREYVVYAGEGDETTARVGNPEAFQAVEPQDAPTPDVLTMLPESAQVLAHESADLDGDQLPEEVVVAAYGGAPDRLGYDRLELFILELDRPDSPIAWQGELTGERAEPLQLQDINNDGLAEALITTDMGAEGQTLHVFGWRGEAYDFLRPHRGYFDLRDSFGENAARIEDANGDGVYEILASYGPQASITEVYEWDGNAYTHTRTVEAGS